MRNSLRACDILEWEQGYYPLRVDLFFSVRINGFYTINSLKREGERERERSVQQLLFLFSSPHACSVSRLLRDKLQDHSSFKITSRQGRLYAPSVTSSMNSLSSSSFLDIDKALFFRTSHLTNLELSPSDSLRGGLHRWTVAHVVPRGGQGLTWLLNVPS